MASGADRGPEPRPGPAPAFPGQAPEDEEEADDPSTAELRPDSCFPPLLGPPTPSWPRRLHTPHHSPASSSPASPSSPCTNAKQACKPRGVPSKLALSCSGEDRHSDAARVRATVPAGSGCRAWSPLYSRPERVHQAEGRVQGRLPRGCLQTTSWSQGRARGREAHLPLEGLNGTSGGAGTDEAQCRPSGGLLHGEPQGRSSSPRLGSETIPSPGRCFRTPSLSGSAFPQRPRTAAVLPAHISGAPWAAQNTGSIVAHSGSVLTLPSRPEDSCTARNWSRASAIPCAESLSRGAWPHGMYAFTATLSEGPTLDLLAPLNFESLLAPSPGGRRRGWNSPSSLGCAAPALTGPNRPSVSRSRSPVVDCGSARQGSFGNTGKQPAAFCNEAVVVRELVRQEASIVRGVSRGRVLGQGLVTTTGRCQQRASLAVEAGVDRPESYSAGTCCGTHPESRPTLFAKPSGAICRHKGVSTVAVTESTVAGTAREARDSRVPLKETNAEPCVTAPWMRHRDTHHQLESDIAGRHNPPPSRTGHHSPCCTSSRFPADTFDIDGCSPLGGSMAQGSKSFRVTSHSGPLGPTMLAASGVPVACHSITGSSAGHFGSEWDGMARHCRKRLQTAFNESPYLDLLSAPDGPALVRLKGGSCRFRIRSGSSFSAKPAVEIPVGTFEGFPDSGHAPLSGESVNTSDTTGTQDLTLSSASDSEGISWRDVELSCKKLDDMQVKI